MNSLSTISPPCMALGGQSFIEIVEKGGLIPPITNKTKLLDVLNYVSFMSRMTIAAIDQVKKHEWRQLDALVGDCACQLRAAKIKDLADLYLTSTEWQLEIEAAQAQAKSILQQLPALRGKKDKEISSGQVFKDLYGSSASVSPTTICKEWNILQPLSDNVRFIVESYLLTQTKMQKPKENSFHIISDMTNAEQLNCFNTGLDGLANNRATKIGAKKLKELTLVLQRDLSTLSVEYLNQEAGMLNDTPENRVAKEVLRDDLRTDKMGRLCAPCFYTLESLMQRLINKNQHLLIDVMRWDTTGTQAERVKMLYAPNRLTETFELMSLDGEKELPKTVFVIVGHCIREDQHQWSAAEYINMFNSYSLEEIINANCAQHSQYPGTMDLDVAPIQDKRRAQLAERAQQIGCTADNLSLFSVYHIFCDRLDAALANREQL